jgi:16S rRNA U1498 N3-methylase RsmE
MNSFLVFESEKSGDSYLIHDKERINHVQKVLKSSAGDSLNVCLVNQGLGKGILEEISSDHLKIKLVYQDPIPVKKS